MATQKQPQEENTTSSPKTHSLIASIIIGVAVFAFLLLALETISRTDWFASKVSTRSLGIYHKQFEIKWFKLEDYVKENGGVDVLLLGNSMVNTGIDPDVLSAEYEKLTGEHLRIFNFGVEGLTVAPTSVIAKILAEKYQPSAFLFVTEMRDYVAENGLTVENQLLSDEWFRAQKTAPFTLRGWLKLNSSAIKYLLPFRNWSRADFPDTFLMYLRRWGDTSASGYEGDLNTGKDIDKHPDPNDPEEAENFAMFQNFSIDSGRLDDLNVILNSGDSVQMVIVTEMPLYPTYFDYFGGEKVHEQYLDTLKAFVEQKGGVYLPPLGWELIPLDYRVDNHHLNIKGAPVFSTLLAEQLASLCNNEGLCLQSSPVTGVEQ
ncbi:MAG: hypothetical protein KBF64_02285 [Anaerolineaceae bacterium]|nr:hypothetical protein [Anaerolineaceae bacterium]